MDDMSATGGRIRITLLGAGDAPAAHALYLKVVATVPRGFLTERDADGFDALLADPGRSLSVGAWSGDRLVGYNLHTIEPDCDRGEGPVMNVLRQRGESLLVNHGTVIDPGFRLSRLADRLIAARQAEARMRGLAHASGLIAVDNVRSLRLVLSSGFWLVAVERDAYCLNFRYYTGSLLRELPLKEAREEAAADTDGLASLFDRGWVATMIERGRGERPDLLTLRSCEKLARARG